MPTVGQAYVQIIPSAQGISGAIQKELNGGGVESAGTAAGQGFGKKLIAAVAGLGIGAAITKGIKSSISEGADLQQSLGGVETLFRKNADIVIKNAQNAYKTAGLSANAYMETVTSFSASLLQSLGGDTGKAAKSADSALRDMSDNANKFGTDMGSIQQAYQGFAKQNYTMLDNLKLGYGGTKTEMERLLADAGKLSGQKYDISSLDDVYSAIHVIQKEMGVTGTTAKEASTTFSGSFESMKSSASNVLGNLAIGEDIGPSLSALGETVSTFISGNLLPMLGNIASQIPSLLSSAVSGLTKAFPGIAKAGTTLLNNLTQSISGEGGSKMIESGLSLVTQLAQSIGSNIGPLIAAAAKLIGSLAVQIIAHIPQILTCGAEIITSLLTGIGTAIDILSEVGNNILNKISESISSFAQNTLKPAGEKIIKTLSTAVKGKFSEISKAVSDKMNGVKAAITTAWTNIKSVFTTRINNIKTSVSSGFNAIKTRITSVMAAVKSKISSVVTGIKTTMTNGFNRARDSVLKVFDKIKSGISEKIQAAKDKVQSVINAIKKLFPFNVGKIFSGWVPKIKLTTSKKGDSASTNSSVGKTSFAKAMSQPYMFRRPTEFYAGEAGDEMLYGRTSLMRDIKSAVSANSGIGNGVVNYITVNGAEDPEQWASKFARQLKMEVRMA